MSSEKIFEHHIYGSGRAWRDHPCGSGSTPENTQQLKTALPIALKDLGVNSLLDAACGDYSWMSSVEWYHDIAYTGADIVSRLIEENRQRYPNVDFRVLDIVRDPLPTADMILVRDCLIHLSNSDILEFLHNFLRCDIKLLAASNYAVKTNVDIETGRYRSVNLYQEPFKLGEPLMMLPDGVDISTGKARVIGIWHRNQIETALGTQS